MATVNDPHALWLTLTNLWLGLVMLGAGATLGASWYWRGRVAVAKTTPAPRPWRASEVSIPEPVSPAVESSGATAV